MSSKEEKITQLAQLIRELKYWKNLTESSHFNKKDRKEQYYKSCYQICELLNWDTNLLRKIEPQLGLTAYVVRAHAREYALEILKLTETKLNEKIASYIQKPVKEICCAADKYNSILNQIINETDKTKIIQIIKQNKEKYQIGIGNLRKHIPIFVAERCAGSNPTLIRALEDKIAIYKEYEREENRKLNKPKTGGRKKELPTKEEVAETSLNYIKKFISEGFSQINEFCNKEGIQPEHFDNVLLIVKKTDYDLYQQFLNILVMRNNSHGLETEAIIKQMVCQIKNGIKEIDGTTRRFDAIDFYSTTTLSYKEFSRLLETTYLEKILTTEEIRTLKRFFKLNMDNFLPKLISNPKNLIQDLKTTIYLTSDTNEQIRYYPTDDEAQFIIKFLKKKNMPLNRSNFIVAMYRYLNNTLPLNHNKNKARRLTDT